MVLLLIMLRIPSSINVASLGMNTCPLGTILTITVFDPMSFFCLFEYMKPNVPYCSRLVMHIYYISVRTGGQDKNVIRISASILLGRVLTSPNLVILLADLYICTSCMVNLLQMH